MWWASQLLETVDDSALSETLERHDTEKLSGEMAESAMLFLRNCLGHTRGKTFSVKIKCK